MVGLLMLKEQSAAAFINNSIYKLWLVFTTYNKAIISFTHFCEEKEICMKAQNCNWEEDFEFFSIICCL